MLLPALLCYSGFTALCLSMERHYADLLGGKPGTRRCLLLRSAGWLLLALSLCGAVATRGVTMGLVEWAAVLMGSGVLLVFLMPYQPRWVVRLALVGLLASPVVALQSYIVWGG
ncbi:DUF3325 domain-containing protein [uncultured Pseudomonas sp.]|uniref:DUF3325 domain-containing protein n=1 Tax=uncultured Pseudomonas sp. TaxID=114707 RepID=UPI0025D2170E|nr:DUF3325 domain-containing protein [uncultured Pseudomonas sp.]